MNEFSNWLQVTVEFTDYAAAEPTAVEHLAPLFVGAEETGLITTSWFIRKSPCWRLRYHQIDQEARAFVHDRLDQLRSNAHIASWAETIYEPEVHAFGGAPAMHTAHQLFHHDSSCILNHIAAGRNLRRELSILLSTRMLRAAGQDWYEQGDVWARLTENRPLPGAPRAQSVHIAEQVRRLLTVDTSPLFHTSGSLAHANRWSAAFDAAGAQLGELARAGSLRRGLRAVLTHHVLFHWNRIGLPLDTQSALAHAARTVILKDERH